MTTPDVGDRQPLRIGAGPAASDSPFVIRKRRSRTPLYIAGVIVFALAAGTAIGIWLVRDDPSGTPSAAATMGTATVCQLLIPVMIAGQHEVQESIDHPNLSTVDWAQVDKILVALEALEPGAPPNMRGDIGAIIGPLRQLQQIKETRQNATMQLEAYRSAGIRLTVLCTPYASQ